MLIVFLLLFFLFALLGLAVVFLWHEIWLIMQREEKEFKRNEDIQNEYHNIYKKELEDLKGER